jgi:two-component system chemotaxis sensor kinase CheA
MDMQDDETLRMYVEESREHLSDIENDLLSIEEAGADIDEERVNKVFRAAHSIKGGAGFMGLNNIKELSHKIENVLGMIRSREIIPDPEVVNILLVAFYKLRELINNVDDSDQMDVSEHTVALNGITTAYLPASQKTTVARTVDIHLPDGKVVFKVSEFDVIQARKTGKFIYLVEYDLIHDVHKKGKTPLDILNLMQDSGILLDCKVDVASVGTLDDEEVSSRLPFFVLFATIIEPDIIGAIFEVDEEYIRLIEDENEAAPVSAQPPGGNAAPFEQPPPAPVQSYGEEVSDVLERGREFELQTQPGRADKVASDVHVREPVSDVRAEAPRKAGRVAKAATVTQPETSLRVNVALLDTLMTLAGELVLSRNQLLQAISSGDRRSTEIGAQRINLVTSELQEAIMLTRMQPIGNIFNKFPRVVRDMALDLGREIALTIEGKEVELDKTLIEGLSDPLTHLVRNSIDHGIETPETRMKAGKSAMGLITLKAYHEAGQVNLEVIDDGKGLDGARIASAAVAKDLISEEQVRTMSEKEKISLIFLPGFSTAEKVTDISGRGVGMDVVKTNLDRLGGIVDISSAPGKGTSIRIKLPLTLAILPSLLVSTAGERFAIPQVNVDELLRIPASQVKNRIEKVGDADVVRLRETLLPLLSLSDVLGLERTYVNPEDGSVALDRRRNIADRRSRKSPLFGEGSGESETCGSNEPGEESRLSGQARRQAPVDRRRRAGSALNIVVVSAGAFKYGLVVETLHDSEEIVVKPLGRHLKQCRGYAGATIMGDGRVALILDVASLAQMADLTSLAGTDRASEVAGEMLRLKGQDLQSLLLFGNASDERFAVPLDLVARVEQIKASDIETVGGSKVIKYRGRSLPVFAIEEVARVKPMEIKSQLLVIVFHLAGREVGLLAATPVDAANVTLHIDNTTLRQTGIMGSVIIGNQTTLIVDIFELVETLRPAWFAERKAVRSQEQQADKTYTVLLAEDSEFFRHQVKKFLEDEGLRVIAAEDGAVAWQRLEQHSDVISVVVTDIEMPNLNGYELTKKIKEDRRFSHLPVIAVTSLAGDESIAKGKDVGIDDYQIKLDKEKLIESVHGFMR